MVTLDRFGKMVAVFEYVNLNTPDEDYFPDYIKSISWMAHNLSHKYLGKTVKNHPTIKDVKYFLNYLQKKHIIRIKQLSKGFQIYSNPYEMLHFDYRLRSYFHDW